VERCLDHPTFLGRLALQLAKLRAARSGTIARPLPHRMQSHGWHRAVPLGARHFRQVRAARPTSPWYSVLNTISRLRVAISVRLLPLRLLDFPFPPRPGMVVRLLERENGCAPPRAEGKKTIAPCSSSPNEAEHSWSVGRRKPNQGGDFEISAYLNRAVCSRGSPRPPAHRPIVQKRCIRYDSACAPFRLWTSPCTARPCVPESENRRHGGR